LVDLEIHCSAIVRGDQTLSGQRDNEYVSRYDEMSHAKLAERSTGIV